MITVEVDGTQYENFIDIELGMSLSAIARDFRMTIAQPQGASLPFVGGEKISIFVDNELRLEGSIYTVTPTVSKSQHQIVMTGRSTVGDLVDSSLLPVSLTADISLQQVIEQVINDLGLQLSVTNNVSGLADFNPAEDKISAEAGDNAFQFIETLARKRQVLLTSDPVGNIVITRNGTEKNPVVLLNQVDGSDGNIISSSISYDVSKRYNRTVVVSQLNGSANSAAGIIAAAEFSDQRGEQTDPSIRAGRQLVMNAEKSSSSEECTQRAIWQANIARVRGRNYSVTVQGTRPKGGDIWEPNRLQEVVDDQSGINELMLIDSVRFSQSRNQGTLTKLGLVDQDAYSVSLAEPPPSQKKDDVFALF